MVSAPNLFKTAALAIAVLSLPISSAAQQVVEEAPQLDVPYVPTRTPVVEKMLEMGQVGPEDFVIDLGSGDGRILVAAAKRGAHGFGVDLNPVRIAEANANAKEAGVTERVRFVRQDLFETPISEATVLTMYLLPEVNLRLRPRILDELKPGTRVVSHAFDMDEWRPERTAEVDGAIVHLWIVPAKVAGHWTLTDSSGRQVPVELKQSFQLVAGMIGSGAQQAALGDPYLEGDLLRFTADLGGGRRLFEGRVRGNRVEPVAKPATSAVRPAAGWRLTRAS